MSMGFSFLRQRMESLNKKETKKKNTREFSMCERHISYKYVSLNKTMKWNKNGIHLVWEIKSQPDKYNESRTKTEWEMYFIISIK